MIRASGCSIIGLAFGEDSVSKKAKDPKMTLHENPMFHGRDDPVEKINFHRMHEDLRNRNNPCNGHIYEAFKSVTYKKED